MSDTEKTLNVYNPCEDIRKRIEDYVGKDNIESLFVNMVGNGFTAELKYVDFKPSKVLRREFDNVFPNVEFTVLHRGFSYESYMKLLQEMFENDEEIYVKKSDGTLRPMSISMCLNERLHNRVM